MSPCKNVEKTPIVEIITTKAPTVRVTGLMLLSLL